MLLPDKCIKCKLNSDERLDKCIDCSQPEPLINKTRIAIEVKNKPLMFLKDDVKSAVEGLIKYHEDLIEEKIKAINNTLMSYDYYKWIDSYILSIKKEYENIQVIEHWLEDVI